MWTREELKTRAKELLSLNYWKAVLVSLILAFISGSGGGGGGASSSSSSGDEYADSFSSDIFSNEFAELLLGAFAVFLIIILIVLLVSIALSYFVFVPLQIGCHRYFVLCDSNESSFDDVSFVFSNSYLNVVKIMFFYNLYIFLWSLLFIIPGIIKSYEYRMIPYILAEYPNISKKDAFALTKKMMTGNKLDSWVLDLSFIGWDILGAFTCCILYVFFVNPYRDLTYAQLYLTLKKHFINDFPHSTNSTYQESYTGSYASDTNPYLH